MNYVRLVEMLKELSKEKHLTEANVPHSARYRATRRLNVASIKEPDKTPQLAEEEDDEKAEKKSGKTDTGKPANKIITEPEMVSQVPHPKGVKPQIDTK